MFSLVKMQKEKMPYGFLFICLLLFTITMFAIPFNHGPDEKMRFTIAQYIYEYGNIPRGDNPEIIDSTWGISYAFTPINSYIISGYLMKIASHFGAPDAYLLYVARAVSVIFCLLTVLFCIKIGKKVFSGVYVWCFVVLVALLPEFIFISGYVNCDAIAMFSVSWITYALVVGEEKNWDVKRCIFLGIGIGICLLSYYNAYGVILFSIFYCILSVVRNEDIDNKVKFIASRAAVVLLFVFLISGWWFIRNGVLYNGDILGLSASSKCAELNAKESYKPSNRMTPFKRGYSLSYMLFDMEWIDKSMKSFVAAFDYMLFWLSDKYYQIYYLLISIGLMGGVVSSFISIIKRKRIGCKKEMCQQKPIDNVFFWGCMVGTCVVTISISIYYSYFNDFQAQGRYCLPMLVAFSLLIVKGINQIGNVFGKAVGKLIASVLCMYMFYLAFYSIGCNLVNFY